MRAVNYVNLIVTALINAKVHGDRSAWKYPICEVNLIVAIPLKTK